MTGWSQREDGESFHSEQLSTTQAVFLLSILLIDWEGLTSQIADVDVAPNYQDTYVTIMPGFKLLFIYEIRPTSDCTLAL